MESWPKVKLGSHCLPLLGLIFEYHLIYHFVPDSTFFIFIFQYLALFTYIYPHLALFAPIWLYLPPIALIWPYMPYSPYIYILLVKLHLCKILKQSSN